jgi:hypothetical protein
MPRLLSIYRELSGSIALRELPRSAIGKRPVGIMSTTKGTSIRTASALIRVLCTPQCRDPPRLPTAMCQVEDVSSPCELFHGSIGVQRDMQEDPRFKGHKCFFLVISWSLVSRLAQRAHSRSGTYTVHSGAPRVFNFELYQSRGIPIKG